MAAPKTHPVVEWWLKGSDGWWDVPIMLLFVIGGGFAGFGAFEAWNQGHWPLFVLLALAATACLVAAGPQLLGELLVYLVVALAVLTAPLLLFPRTRVWYQRVWGGVNKELSTK
ncbi:hypothetical protein [Nocardia sp. XZ_19_385]|uniref:hypothetical protein n=1 Tax=Nocardia sp. XZ_19_385 TaxID=2769488 RepID=UPI00188F3654|nr:hypothetical protein [Nocardia sp. XZ_19_385]